MRKVFALALSTIISFTQIDGTAVASDGYTYQTVGTPSTSSSGLDVTLNSLQLLEKTGSIQLLISYTQKNNTVDKKLDEGSFKLFFTDGSSEPQYGFFNSFYPGDGNTRTYTWEWLKGKEPWLIEWDAGFFSSVPSTAGLKWKVGESYPAQNLASPDGSASGDPTLDNSTAQDFVELPVNFSGGDIDQDSILKFKSTPYKITNLIRTFAGTTLRVEAGVQIETSAGSTLFGGSGEVDLVGTEASPVWITGPELVWSPYNSGTSGFRASHVNFREIGALLPWETYEIGTYILKNSTVIGRPSSATKSVLFQASSLTIENTYFESVPGFELQNLSNANYSVNGNWFNGNSLTNVPSWGIKGQWIISDALTSFKDNSFINFSTPVIFKLWSSKTLDISGNYFNGLGVSDISRIRTMDSVQRTATANGVVTLTTVLKESKPLPIESLPKASNVSKPEFTYVWSGTSLKLDFLNVPIGSKLQLKLGVKWISVPVNKKENFTFSKTETPSGKLTFYLNGVIVEQKSIPTKFSTCSDVWKLFDGGIAKSNSSKNKGAKVKKKATVYSAAYLASSKLDIDKDGLLCER